MLPFARRLLEYVIATRPIPGPGLTARQSSSGVTFATVRGPSGPASRQTLPLPFAEIITYVESDELTRGIRGGLISAGDKNWHVPHQAINLAVDGEWYVSIPVAITANRDDDDEILLPSIDTSAQPPTAWTLTAATGAGYPDHTSPSVPGGAGTIVCPVGILTVADGVASLEPTGVGGFYLDQIAGGYRIWRNSLGSYLGAP